MPTTNTTAAPDKTRQVPTPARVSTRSSPHSPSPLPNRDKFPNEPNLPPLCFSASSLLRVPTSSAPPSPPHHSRKFPKMPDPSRCAAQHRPPHPRKVTICREMSHSRGANPYPNTHQAPATITPCNPTIITTGHTHSIRPPGTGGISYSCPSPRRCSTAAMIKFASNRPSPRRSAAPSSAVRGEYRSTGPSRLASTRSANSADASTFSAAGAVTRDTCTASADCRGARRGRLRTVFTETAVAPAGGVMPALYTRPRARATTKGGPLVSRYPNWRQRVATFPVVP
jgi:hypothetical protein